MHPSLQWATLGIIYLFMTLSFPFGKSINLRGPSMCPTLLRVKGERTIHGDSSRLCVRWSVMETLRFVERFAS